MPKIAYTVAAINTHLKAKGSKVRVESRAKGALNLRAVLPPKPLSDRPLPFQQRIPLNLYESPDGLKRAEYEAEKLHGALMFNTFDWSQYATTKTAAGSSTAEIVELFKAHYFANNDLAQRTWAHNWQRYFDKLPQKEPLSANTLERVVKATPAHSYVRGYTIRVLKRWRILHTLRWTFPGLKVIKSEAELR